MGQSNGSRGAFFFFSSILLFYLSSRIPYGYLLGMLALVLLPLGIIYILVWMFTPGKKTADRENDEYSPIPAKKDELVKLRVIIVMNLVIIILCSWVSSTPSYNILDNSIIWLFGIPILIVTGLVGIHSIRNLYKSARASNRDTDYLEKYVFMFVAVYAVGLLVGIVAPQAV